MANLRVMVLGQSNVGKSYISNKLLGYGEHDASRFIECDDKSTRRVFGIQYKHADVDLDGEVTHLHVVDTPGFFPTPTTKADKNWRDIVHAFDIARKDVSAFLLVLKADDPDTGKKVVQAFWDFFGAAAVTRCVVLFKCNENPFRENLVRRIKVDHFEYLKNLLKEDFPCCFWREDGDMAERSRKQLINMMTITADKHHYTIREFSESQYAYTCAWLEKQKVKVKKLKIRTREDFFKLGLPDILFDESRCFTESQVESLLKIARK